MSTILTSQISQADGGQCIELRDLDWDGYSTMLRLRGDRSNPKLIYLDGSLWLVSPSHIHESAEWRLGRIVEVILEELAIPFHAAGSTTFSLEEEEAGAEPDESYYLANEANVRESDDRHLILGLDPPPDLVIEVVYTHGASKAIEAYRRFEVPEVWVWKKPVLSILRLGPGGRYVDSDQSLAFPFLKSFEIVDWASRPKTGSDLNWLREFRRWVREVLIPRGQGED